MKGQQRFLRPQTLMLQQFVSKTVYALRSAKPLELSISCDMSFPIQKMEVL